MEKEIGPETKVKAEIANGGIKLSVDYVGKQVGAGAYVTTSSDQLLDALGDLIPGDSSLEKGAIALLKAFFGTVKV